VYGLGATLYALATGFPPFHEGTLLSVIRQVTDDDPKPPRWHRPELPRDLELIIQMAMEKERQRRYSTAEEFSKDLTRFLDGLPVVAHPPSLAYRIRKRVARHKAAFVTGLIGAAMVSLVAGLLVPRWLEERAAAQGHEMQLQLQREEQRRSEEGLRELATLWGDVLLAKQGWYQAQRDPADTRAALNAAILAVGSFIDRNPSLPQGYYIRARGRVYLEDLPGAREDLDAALRLDPGFAPAWTLLGRVCIDQYRAKLYGRDTSKPDRLARVRPLLDEARDAFSRGVDPGSDESSIRRWGLRKMRDDEVAETVARALSAWYIENDRARARALLHQALERSPSEEYYNLLGIWEDDARRGIELQTEALRMMPHFARAYHDRGTRHWSLEDHRRAEEDYTTAIRINPRFLPAYVNRSLMRARRGDMAGVLEDASRAIAIDPTVEEAYLNRSYAHQAMNNLDAALRDAATAIKLDPRFAEAYVNASMAKIRMGDFQGALEDADRAVELSPTLVEAWLDRGAARSRLGDFTGAMADFTKAIELSPNHPEAHFNRGALKATIASDLAPNADELRRSAEQDFLKALEYAPADWPHRPLVDTMLRLLRGQPDR
jgi:tetratricopeptide (TPR) repeat protein